MVVGQSNGNKMSCDRLVIAYSFGQVCTDEFHGKLVNDPLKLWLSSELKCLNPMLCRGGECYQFF